MSTRFLLSKDVVHTLLLNEDFQVTYFEMNRLPVSFITFNLSDASSLHDNYSFHNQFPTLFMVALLSDAFSCPCKRNSIYGKIKLQLYIRYSKSTVPSSNNLVETNISKQLY